MDDKLKAKLEEALSSIGMLNNEINALESQMKLKNMMYLSN